MAGTLYLCATPIGNLEDITFRVIRVLGEVDVIAAEDTRHSIKLLNHFDIKTPMTSYHEFNKFEKGPYLIQQLLDGKNIALVTDAGTPGISDPGEDLVRLAYEAGVEVTSLPGPVACVTALTLSGLGTRRFCFESFLPTDKKEKQRILSELAVETRTIMLYEAPHRLLKTLKELKEVLGDRKISLVREITKRHETVLCRTIQGIIDFYDDKEVKGECVLVIEGRDPEEMAKEEQEKWETMTIEEHMEVYLSKGMDKKEAMKAVALDRGISKRDVYQFLLKE